MIFAENQGGIQHCARNAMRKALPGISHRDINIFTARVPADKASVIDGVEHLPGPAMRHLAKPGDQVARPRFKLPEAFIRIVRLTALMILAPDQDIIGLSLGPAEGAHSDKDLPCPSRARRATRRV